MCETTSKPAFSNKSNKYFLERDTWCVVLIVSPFKKLSELDPTSPVAFYQMGVLQEQKRNDELALSHYLQAVKLNPTFVDAHYNLAMVYARKREFSKAVEAMEIAKKNAPKDQDIAQMLNRPKADLKKKK